MPSQYYVDKNLKSILFPTLLCCMFRNPNNMKIVLNEMDKSYFLELLQMDVNYYPYYSQNNSKKVMGNNFKDHHQYLVQTLRIRFFHIALQSILD